MRGFKLKGDNPKRGIAKVSKIELNIDFYGKNVRNSIFQSELYCIDFKTDVQCITWYCHIYDKAKRGIIMFKSKRIIA